MRMPNWAAVEALDRQLTRNATHDYAENVRIFEDPLAHARAIGAWREPHSLAGLEVDLRLAAVLNGRRATE